MASMVEHGSAINHSVEKARKRTSRRRGLILNELLSGVTTAAIIVIALTGLGTGRHYSGSADPGECAGHGGHFKARRSWTAWRQIRADRNPIRQHRARDQNPSERQPERRTGTPRQQIRADGTPLHFREMTAGSLPLSPSWYRCHRTRLVNPSEPRSCHCGLLLSGWAFFRQPLGSG